MCCFSCKHGAVSRILCVLAWVALLTAGFGVELFATPAKAQDAVHTDFDSGVRPDTVEQDTSTFFTSAFSTSAFSTSAFSTSAFSTSVFTTFATSTPSVSSISTPPTSTTIREKKVGSTMVVGLLRDRPPLGFANSTGQVRGLAVDLALMLNYSLGVKTVFRMGTFQELSEMLKRGTIDYICGVPLATEQEDADPDRLSLITSFGVNRRILVSRQDIHVTCEQDYKDRTLVMLAKDKYQDLARKSGATVLLVNEYTEGFRLLESGKADAFVVPSGEIATYIAQQQGRWSVRFMGLSLERSPLAILMPSGQADLMAHLSGALARFEAHGELDVLREKWLGKQVIIEPSFWQTYHRVILYSAVIMVLVVLGTLGWTMLLRRQVANVTQKLRHSELRYRELTEASPDLVVLLDAKGQIRLANRLARNMLLCQSVDSPSGALIEALCSEGRASLDDILCKALAGNTAKKEITINPNGPSPRLLEFIAFPTAESQTGERLVCCIARDMTERQRMENELMQVERLAVIGKLAAGIAHEINNPLGIILTNAEFMQDLDTDPTMVPHLAAIRRNVERAASITSKLLHLAVPARMSVEPMNLNDIVLESLSFLKPQLKSVHVDMTHLHSALPMQGDRGLLEQLIINLLLNALDSMRHTGTLVIAGDLGTEEGTETIRLVISDTGKGIAKAYLEKIFDIFYTTKGSQGFGLGLFVSRRIAEQHGGLLYAESEEGKGASLILEFPALVEGRG